MPLKKHEQIKVIQQHLEALAEHFDTIQIFVTQHATDDGEQSTISLHLGSGNWYARYGQIAEWLIKEKIMMKVEVKDQLKEDDEEID